MKQQFVCGTSSLQELNEAAFAYHEGKPLGDHIVLDEVIMSIHDDWRDVGTLISDGEETPVFTPKVVIENENVDTVLFSPDEINGFIPLRGHYYQLRVRRFRCNSAPFYCRYELIEVISDQVRHL